MWGVNITLDLSRKELNASFWEGVSLSSFSFSKTSNAAPRKRTFNQCFRQGGQRHYLSTRCINKYNRLFKLFKVVHIYQHPCFVCEWNVEAENIGFIKNAFHINLFAKPIGKIAFILIVCQNITSKARQVVWQMPCPCFHIQ